MKKSLYIQTLLLLLIGTMCTMVMNRYIAQHLFEKEMNQLLQRNFASSLMLELNDPTFTSDESTLAKNLMRSVHGATPSDVLVAIGPSAAAQRFTTPSVHWQTSSRPGDGNMQEALFTLDDAPWSAWRALTPKGEVYAAVSQAALNRITARVFDTRISLLAIQGPVIFSMVILLSLMTSYFVLRPLKQLNAHFKHIRDARDLRPIQPDNSYREFSEFIDYFNDLLERLHKSHHQAARFSSDASHELRTPLTIIRGHLNQAIHQATDGSALQIQLAMIANEVERMISISDKLLQLSQADAGRMQLAYTQVNISDMLGELLEDSKSLHAHLTIRSQIARPLHVHGDAQLIWQLISNLFSNAVKFNQANGWIEVIAQPHQGRAVLRVTNVTSHNTSRLAERAFERFYRHAHEGLQAAPAIPGFGLGLSLCREIVLAHRGEITLVCEPAHVVCVTVSLPLATA